MKGVRMRALILIVGLAVASNAAANGWLPAKFVSDDGTLTVFLDESLTDAHIMFGYGSLVPLEATATGDSFTARLGADIAVRGARDGDALRLTLRRGDAEETLTLARRHGGSARPYDGALLALLAAVPDTPNSRLGGVPGVGYADVGAAVALASGPTPTTRAEFDALGDEALASWSAAWRRLEAGPAEFRLAVREMVASMDDLLGFEPFAVDRVLGFGRPPTLGIVLAAEVDTGRLGDRLAGRDFAMAVLDGFTVWHRNEDGRVSLDQRAPGDPFVGRLGMAARIAVLPSQLVGTRFWSMTHEVVSTAAGHYPSLADSIDYRTLAEVAQEGDGTLIQAQFLGPLDAGFVPADPFALLRDGVAALTPDGPGLPPYGLALLADRQEGVDQVALIALFYPDVETAAAAAAILAARLASFATAEVASWDVRVDPPRVYLGEDGVAAAVASLRHPLATAAAEGAPAGGAFALWLRAFVTRDLGLLTIGP
jgi:hypothetical protein